MIRNKKYKFNEETLSYELQRITFKERFSKAFIFFLFSIVAFIGYCLIYTTILGLELPKTFYLKQENVSLNSKLELLNRNFDQNMQVLNELQIRDNNIYRPIFGMEEIPTQVRDAGFGGVDRYAYIEAISNSTTLKNVQQRMDILFKKAFIQSQSYDEVSILAKRAGDMAQCVPAIPPVSLDNTRFASSFGFRTDPLYGTPRMHQGIDLAGDKGEPIYAVGNGKVVEVGFNFFGYGNEVVIDHGFGYKTRYAHLDKIFVKKGDVVARGNEIAALGNTGKSTGAHLHYEVLYRDNRVNPLNYYNQDIKPEEFKAMVKPINREILLGAKKMSDGKL